MPRALGDQVYLCGDCEDGGSLRDIEPISPETTHVVIEHQVVKKEMGRRVLGIVLASSQPEDSRASMPVLIEGGVELGIDEINEDSFRQAVFTAYADCPGPNPDESCGAFAACSLRELLTQHRRTTPLSP